MKHLSVRPVLLVLFILSLPAAAQTPDPAAKVDEIFAEWKSQESPGCTVAVSEAGKTLLCWQRSESEPVQRSESEPPPAGWLMSEV
jgi:CubicO group peptidase (beta-lactamase class C family)